MMKKILFLSLIVLSTPAMVFADSHVNGYFKKDGTYVAPHERTSPNSTNWDNYSTKGNTNPYTGSSGTRAQDYSPEAHNYGSGHPIYQGSHGGEYYINDKGHKVYVPKQ